VREPRSAQPPNSTVTIENKTIADMVVVGFMVHLLYGSDPMVPIPRAARAYRPAMKARMGLLPLDRFATHG
jgi:hypothetical protein